MRRTYLFLLFPCFFFRYVADARNEIKRKFANYRITDMTGITDITESYELPYRRKIDDGERSI